VTFSSFIMLHTYIHTVGTGIMQVHGGQVMLPLCQYLQLGILCNTRDNRSHTVKNEIAQAPSCLSRQCALST
jgi:hypothetical protein